MILDEFELLCDRPVHVDSVGLIKKPQLYDIREIGYDTYELMCNYLSVDFNKYIEITGLKEKYNALSDEGKAINTFFTLLIRNQEFREAYKLIFSFFISENILLNDKEVRFEFYQIDRYEESNKETSVITESKVSKFFRKLFKKIDIFNLFNHKSDYVEIDNKIQKLQLIEHKDYLNDHAKLSHYYHT